jgi:hypothetical protein
MFQGKIQDGGLDDDGMLLSAAKLAGQESKRASRAKELK